MTTISIVNYKGGSGKSTTATHLVHYAANVGYSVAVIDCDRQESSAKWVEQINPDIDLFCSTDVDEIEDAIADMQGKYDLIVVDTAGSSDEIMKMVIGYSTQVLIPVSPSELDICSTKDTITQITRARRRFDKEIPTTVFLNKVVANTVMRRNTVELFKGIDDITFSNVEIPSTQRIIRLANTNQTVFNANGCADLATKFESLFENIIG